MRGAGEEALQGSGPDSRLAKLARGAGGRGGGLDLIALRFCGAAGDCEGCCLARTGEALDSLDAVRRGEHILDDALLCAVELRVLVGNGDRLRTRKNWIDLVLSLTHPQEDFMFRLDGFGGGELTARNALGALDDLKFPGTQAGVEIGAELGMGDLAHAATEPVTDQRTLINNSLALEVLVARKGERFSNMLKRVEGLLLMLRPFP